MKNLLQKLRSRLDRFMMGRYGMDRFNSVLLWVSVALAVLAMILSGIAGLALTMLSYALMGLAVFRALSHNTYKRYRENRWFLQQWDRLKDREHRYYSCPKCRQSVRVPKGKGKIAITCPKCKEKFIKKT
jgi:membrane protein required for beta-lactamase induction